MTKHKTALEHLHEMRKAKDFPFAEAVSEAVYVALRTQLDEGSPKYQSMPEKAKLPSWADMSEDQTTYAALIISDALLEALPALKGGLLALEEGRFDEVFGEDPDSE